MIAAERQRPVMAAADIPARSENGSQLLDDGLGFVPPVPPTAPAPTTPLATQRFAAFLLIGLGIVFLAGNVLTITGGTLFIGLGLAFLIARIVWRNYGLAVPAGILLGFGGFVALAEAEWLPAGPEGAEGGWFFLLLALGFVAVYAIGARRDLIWPFFPAAALAGFGLLLVERDNLAPFAPFADYGRFWPLVLIAIGGYLLLRDALPRAMRKPLAIIGAIALVAYGLLVLAGGLAS